MSEASRAHALAHAAMVHQGSGDADSTLATAEVFHQFMTADNADAEEPAPKKASKPAPPAGKKAPPAAGKKAPPKDDSDDDSDEGGDTEVSKEDVGAAIEALLNADLRAKAIALFKKYGAKSLSGVKEEDYAAIKQDAEDALMAAG